jgi:hypothetical protein
MQLSDQQMLDIHHLEQIIGKMTRDRTDCLELLQQVLTAINNPNGFNEFRTQVLRERVEVCLDILSKPHGQ